MRVGLVLGGGGTFGLAFHAGALAALAHDLHWDPRTADVIVGTSAGGVIGALLRSGVPAHDLAASMVGVRLLETPAAIVAGLDDRSPAPAFGARDLLRLPRIPELTVMARLARPWTVDPVAAAVSVLPDGRHRVQDHVPLLAAWPQWWPERRLLVTGTRRNDLRRVVFGDHGDRRPTLGEAVAASCAVPGYFAPVEIDGVRYVDGGVRSPTNADVLAGDALDLVVVVSPMSSSGGRAPAVQRPLRRYAEAKLRAERRRLAESGVPSVVLAPGPEVTGPFGASLMGDERLDELTRAAFLDVGRQLTEPAQAAQLRRLGTARV